MAKTGVIIKREFTEFVQTKTFLIMTVLGPLLMAGFIGLEILILTRIGGGESSLVIVDQSPDGVGAQVAQLLAVNTTAVMGKPVKFETAVIIPGENAQHVLDSLSARVTADSLDGYFIVPAGVLTGDTAQYFGQNATNMAVTASLQRMLQQSVQSTRLSAHGIDAAKVADALQPVEIYTEKIGKRAFKGSTEGRQALGYFMIFAIYLVTLLYGQAIMNSVLEEKRDKIVEVIVSSTPARDLMIGKVVGIGAGGFLQMLIWVVFAGLVLAYASGIATMLNLGPEKTAVLVGIANQMPDVPLGVGIEFLLFFLAGFFIYSTLFAMIGSMVTNNQEAQQLVFPAIMPLVIGLFMAMTTLTNPDGSMAVIGSWVPLTAPIVMPIRSVLASASLLEVAGSLLLTFAAGFAVLWLAAKVYRVGIFATGKRPSLREVARWIRAA